MNNKQKLVYLSLIALTIIGILSGASYAYFSIENKIGNETVIESGTMALTFTDGSTITANKLIPGEYIEKQFSVRNTGTVRTNYDIYLSEVVNTFVNQSDLVYEIISSNGYNNSNQVQVPNTETKIINNYPIDPLQEHTYTLRITYKLTNEIQNDNMGRTFIAKINVNEYNSNNSEAYIKLIDASNNLLDKQVITNNTDYYYNLNNYDLTNSTNIYCNNGGIPTIENDTLKVSEVTTTTDCKISNSINTTISNLPNTKTGIVMTDTQNNVTKMNIASGKEVILDLNGKEINSVGINETSTAYNSQHMVFDIFGTFIINDSVGTGGVYTGSTNRAISAGLNSNIIINGGNYNGRQAVYASGSNSSIILNGGNYTNKSGPVIIASDNCSDCVITINDGYYYSTWVDHIIYLVTDGGTININGGVFESKGNSSTIQNSSDGLINIGDGTFTTPTGSNNATVVNEKSGTINITDSNSKVYIGNYYNNPASMSAPKGVYNVRTGNININGHIADNCNENIGSNNSGICIYSIYRSIVNEDTSTGIINVDGASVVSRDFCAMCHYSKKTNVNNAYIKSVNNNAIHVVKNNNVVNPEQSEFNICKSTIVSSSNYKDIYVNNAYVGTAKYYNVTFSNGTTIPGNKVYDPNEILTIGDSCPIN